MKKIVLFLILAVLFTACSSGGWSCKKRYVYTPKTYDYKKHHVLKNYDQYVLTKYKSTKTN